jgi:hypothetical protein
MSEQPETSRATGRVEWLELFFDLVVVAAVAVLSESLREDATYRELGLFLISYGAVWFAWVSVVMYADVAGELTRVRTIIVSMFLLAVMAAAAPGAFEARANVFAAAFVLVRVFAARDSLRTGRLMTAWPPAAGRRLHPPVADLARGADSVEVLAVGARAGPRPGDGAGPQRRHPGRRARAVRAPDEPGRGVSPASR